MRPTADPDRRIARLAARWRCAWALALCVLVLGGPAAPAAAQSPFDYGRLLDQGAAETAAAEEREPPMSRPQEGAGATGATSSPTVEDYARVAAEYEARGLHGALRGVETFRARLIGILESTPDALGEVWFTLQLASPTGRPAYFIGVAVFSLLLIAIGRALNQLIAAYVYRPLFVGLQRPEPHGYAGKLPVLAVRLGLTVVGVLMVVGTASAVGLVYYDGHEATLTTATVIFAAYGAGLTIDTLWRVALCPFLPAYRIPRIGDDAARRLYQGLSVASSFSVIALAFCFWMAELGLDGPVHVVLNIGLGAVMVVVLLVVMRRNRATIAAIIRDGRPREELAWPALLALGLWAPLGALYLVASWARLSFDMVMGASSGPLALVTPFLILAGGLIAFATANYAIERLFSRARRMARINGEAGVEGAPQTGAPGLAALRPGRHPGRRMRTFEDLARRVATLLAAGAASWLLVYTWGGSAVFAESMAFGILEDLVDILLVGYIAFHAVRIWIDNRIAEEVGDEASEGAVLDGEGGGAGATRLATLLPLVRNFVLTVLVIATALVAASEMGFNVGPLFAGAGIVGLAIGFGSQTLVRDILSGAFFLMDDAFRKGEYIDVGEVKGTVEKISLRSFQLRHHLGMLHTIPFGAITHLTNYSRDWVIMKLPLRLTYDTDVERVRKLVKKLGQDLLEDPQIGDKFLQPLKSQGVIHMEDSAMIVRVKFMCRPGEQWVIRKRVYQEIRALFEREGVRFAHREVTVRLPDLEGATGEGRLSDREARAVGAAARQAVEDEAPVPPRIAAIGDER